ncbi:uncharacterized protein [Paramormyrops kingsleyae]|uniref:Coiled-coil domain containing 107 n=1 Tax=Paramormyrops kingsleyae TaxID=1676925 RepID=A0A3B3Q3J8_9TELE|nr:coiled-coil domain-containing protein 107 isoform X1 [Paramormyrops kingsleyae]
MVLSSSQQLVVALTAVLLVFVVLPRIFNSGSGSKESKGFDPRVNRKVGPGTARPHQFNLNSADSKAQTFENMQQVRKMMEKELKSDKYKSNSKGYVFTLMPLYAIGVGVFAVYKFIKIKSKDDAKIEKDKTVNGVKKSAETENQLNELEQRLAQTEKMLNSILTQLDPLTNCVKSVASEQKNEIMSQLQSIRHLMKKRGMDCPLMMAEEFPCEKNLEDVIDSLAAEEDHLSGSLSEGQERLLEEGTAEDGHLDGSEFEGEEGHKSTVSSWEATCGTNAVDEVTTSRDPKADSVVGLRRRNRPE